MSLTLCSRCAFRLLQLGTKRRHLKAASMLISNGKRHFSTTSITRVMSHLPTKKDLFQDLGTYDEDGGDSLISLSMGAPGLEALKGCNDIFLEATKKTLTRENERYIFQYGPLRGDPDCLVALAKFLTKHYGSPVNSENLMVNAGATQGLHLLSTVLFHEETPVFVEDPTFFIAIDTLRNDLGRNIIPVQTDKDGIIPEALERAILENEPKRKPKTQFHALVYFMTTLSNPRGSSSSAERCKELIKVARKYELLLLNDDVYNLFNYPGEQCHPRLFSYDNSSDPDYKGNVVSNGSFAKILGPGLRLGWIEAPKRIIDYLANCNLTRSGGCYNHYTSWLLTVALNNGLVSQHLDRNRELYSHRMDLLCDLLSQGFPVPIKFEKPKDMGGFFLWLELPEYFDSTVLLKIAKEKYGVNFVNGPSTSPTNSFENYIRLSVSYYDDTKLKEGIKRLADAVEEYLKTRT